LISLVSTTQNRFQFPGSIKSFKREDFVRIKQEG
jgi:hypothetical protein